jgi:hypothetical protein
MAVSKFLIHELVFINEMKGATWPDLQRQWLQACCHVLEKEWEQRLCEGHYPSREQFLGNCTLDADYLLDLIGKWGMDWRVGYVVIRLAQDGLYLHPDVKDVVVAGIPVAPLLEELLNFIGVRGMGLGALDAHVLGIYEAWTCRRRSIRSMNCCKPDRRPTGWRRRCSPSTWKTRTLLTIFLSSTLPLVY